MSARRVAAAAVLALALSAPVAGCAHFTSKDAQYAEDGARAACIIANAFLGDEHAIARACSLGAELLDFVRRVASEHRAGVHRELARVGAPPCESPRDAGADR